MKDISVDNLISEIKKEAEEKGLYYDAIDFESLPIRPIDHKPFDRETLKNYLQTNKENRIIAPVYRIESNPVKRFVKAFAKKLTGLLYLNAIEEQERHNERSEMIEELLLSKIEEQDEEIAILKERLKRLEK